MSALTDSTNINTVIEDNTEKLSSPRKIETISTEKATVAAADSTTVAEEGDTSENVPVEANICADKDAEMKETSASTVTPVEVPAEVMAEEKSEDKIGDLVAATGASETTTAATTEATTKTSAQVTGETEKTSSEKTEDPSTEKTEDTPVIDTVEKIGKASKVKTEDVSVEKIKDVSVEKNAESSVEKIEDAPNEKHEDASVTDTGDKTNRTSVKKMDETPITDAIDKNEYASVEETEKSESATETTDNVEAEISMVKEESLMELSPEETKNKISENLIAGRRFMKIDSFNQAVEVLSVSASLAAGLHGEAHEETFEINFLYGKALLEVARVEDGVLANALTDIPKSAEREDDNQDNVVENPENVPQEERAEIKKSVEEALGVVPEEPETMEEESIVEVKEEAEVNEEAEVVLEKNDDVDAEKATADVVEDVEMEGVEEEKAAEEQGAAQDDSSDSDDDDEPIKLAWELLETCRCSCERKIKELEAMEVVDTEAVKTWKLNQADVLTSLGEHGMIDSKYEQAQKDLLEAVAIQAAHLPATSRILANTTHLLAKSFSLDSLFNEAATHFNNSKNVLIGKLEELKKQLESASEEEKGNIELEIKDLEGVIPDIGALVSDARASAQQTEEMKAAAKQELENAAAEIAKISGEEVNDITNMVRRPTKRPAAEESAEEAKKRKSEEGAETVPDEKAAAAPSEESESAAAPVTKE